MDKEQIDSFCNRFMEHFRQQKITDALSMLKSISVIEDAKLAELKKQIEFDMPNISRRFGDVKSYQFVNQKSLGTSIIKMNYILKFEYLYLGFIFEFYNNGSGWRLTHFNYSEDIDPLFD